MTESKGSRCVGRKQGISRRRLLQCAPLLLGSCREASKDAPLVFAAASLKDALTDAARVYASTGGGRIFFNFAGSNQLAQQILNTHKADVFVSANEQWMDVVQHAGKVIAGSRRILLENRLVVIVQSSSSWQLPKLSLLPKLSFSHLAMGDPQAVPAGIYAKQWLENVGLWDRLQDRVLPAVNVRAALAQVAARRDTLGIVYQSDVLPGSGVRILYHADPSRAPKIRYPMARLKSQPSATGTSAFADFLRSHQAGQVFQRFGFQLPR